MEEEEAAMISMLRNYVGEMKKWALKSHQRA